MSKNVAVFVDVANIFYAAKAAGIDIDYVTLLKSATAGRDFVRAYAYTGLDPENENQRQFHSFLARNGYKVISKDIRKYGDGRIKANLDIELVVDMMKTARNLDIAVVVSGDGDFAPAIRAVQEQGVRVEVISFRGNTSSDLIDVADQFTDIAQIARVEKASARSGRRVAAEGDLSMTEVPEKETEGAPRRRRGRSRDERAETGAVAPIAAAGTGRSQANLVALPGERLSRRAAGGESEEVGELAALAETTDMAESESADLVGASDNGLDAALDDGRRRRRRRGGRGRGRGRGQSEFAPTDAIDTRDVAAGAVGAVGATGVADGDEEDEEFEDAQPTQPPHHAFGSVWDSQIGVPSAATAASADRADRGDGDDEDLDEPEVPEYLLAERRQGGQRQGGPGRGSRVPRGRSAYQAALDRERYGSRGPQPSFGSGGGGGGARPVRDRGPERGPDRGRDRGRGGRPQPGGRPMMDRRPRPDDRQMTPEHRSAEPWSEVPPELEELLRAELARKSPTSEPRGASAPQALVPQVTEEPAAAAKPARRPRTTKSAAAAAATESVAEAPKPKARATRSRTTKPAVAASATAESPSDGVDEASAKPAPRRRATTKPATKTPRTTKPAADEG